MKRLQLEINGRVQGVGFRPYLYKLAHQYHLTGLVYNTCGGVILQIQGIQSDLTGFLKALVERRPSQSQIDQIKRHTLPILPDELEFSIVASQTTVNTAGAVLPPDLGTCELCCQEIRDSQNRRYRYPFTNCTDCGPRFTIVQALPYDRHRTTMDEYQMCEVCSAEYHNPLDRRFHAQPNACPICGPQLYLLVPEAQSGELRQLNVVDPLAETVRALDNGKIAVIKGLGGFHLAANATDQAAVEKLRQVKAREAKPLAIMCRDVEQVKAICGIAESEQDLLTSVIRPIVILRKLDDPSLLLAEALAPGQDTLGVMLPYTPLHHLIMGAVTYPLVLTSANLGEQPIAITENEIDPVILSEVAVVLAHNRRIEARCDDSVVAAIPEFILFRRSRGYVPQSIKIPKFRQALGVGGDAKNTACFIRGQAAYFTQHIGNLDEEPAVRAARHSLKHLQNLYELQPEVIGCDLHPEYHSRQFADTLGLPVITVQHHHAHILSCMAEHQLTGKVMGVAFDGTGYGVDGTIWGGEFLVASYDAFTRLASLRPLGMPGGEKAVREPWRMALSYLYESFGAQLPDFPGILPLLEMGGDLLLPMLAQRLNTPETTSAGRLFDAVAALCGVLRCAAYEGEAAMALEGLARRSFTADLSPYPFDLEEKALLRLNWAEMIRSLVNDLRVNRPIGEIAARFHLTVAYGILSVCIKMRLLTGLSQVALSGGVFQNGLLLSKTRQLLQQNHFQVYTQQLVPPNDGGLALGQAVFAAAALER